ncbi:MAG: fumarate reductase flavoprotein subunit, partial [Gammaproteobacteria bacterium]|nr:fumarate reductase flavoprotein subunit [Gammaproteobacteria bacterium]
EVARMFVDEAPRAVRELAHFGVPWTRVRPGNNDYFVKGEPVVIREAEENAGLLMHRDFGGTAKWRTCYASAGTGHAILYAIDSEVIRLGIDVWDRCEALALIHENGRCWGAIARSLRTGELTAVLANATVIATGGYGRIYGKYTTNATINYGSGAAIAFETGVVPLGNMEAVQFHPTGLWPSGILVTEGCRGDGGHLLNRELERFMVQREPEKQELASRDVVSRHMMDQIQNGNGAESGYGPHLWLDLRHLGAEHLHQKLREVVDICRDFAGIDPAQSMIPVRPTQHYSMGGIRVNKDGQAYGMAGLFAAGEAACWDMHGFNRLGGNSLAETIVAGRLVGRSVAAFARREKLDTGTALARRFLDACEADIAAWLARTGDGPRIYAIQSRMAEIMINKVGIFRNGPDLEQAVSELQDCLHDCGHAVLHSKGPGMNPELSDALRLQGMIRLAITIASGALARTESRGAHFRRDFPLRDDRHWLKRTLARWPADTTSPRLSYEPVGLIDLPPGHRGYGKAEWIELGKSLEEYNQSVGTLQDAEGRLASEEPQGSRMSWGAWKSVATTTGTSK